MKKYVVLGIVILFVGTGIVPSINSAINPVKPENINAGLTSFNPFLEGWKNRKKIIIDHTQVEGNLVSFPVLLSFVDSGLRDKAQIDGDDIIFMDDKGKANQLFHEIEYYDSSSGKLIAWVNIPSLSSTVDTDIYIYYGNLQCANQENPEMVWDSNFLCIHHLNGANAYELDDSTTNSNDVMGYGGTPLHEQTGKIGNSVYIDEDEGYYLTNFAKLNNIGNQITVEAWVKRNMIGDWMEIVAKYDNPDGPPPPAEWVFRFSETDTLNWHIRYSDTPELNTYSTTATYTDTSDFHYYAAVHKVGDGTKTHIYYDGNKDTTGFWDFGDGNLIPRDVDYDVSFGNLYYKGNWDEQALHGYLDEVRISNIIRTPEWISTSYNNQNDPSGFFTLSLEITKPRAYDNILFQRFLSNHPNLFPILRHLMGL